MCHVVDGLPRLCHCEERQRRGNRNDGASVIARPLGRGNRNDGRFGSRRYARPVIARNEAIHPAVVRSDGLPRRWRSSQ